MRPGAGGGLLVAAAMTLHDLTSCAVCTQPATQQCDACQLVAYCPGEHEEQHRAKCPAYKVLTNVAVGRFAVAARDLAAGESIFSELPVAVGPKADSSPLCLGCHGLVDGSASCSRCGWPVCGPGCEDSPVHAAAECEVFRAAGVAFQPPQDWTETCCQMECVTPLRLLLSREKCPGRWTREVDAMQSNDERRRDLDAWRAEQVNVVGFLRDRCGLADRACGLLEVNAFEIRMVAGTTIRGLYPQTAILSHNCVANTSHTITPQSDYRLTLRATVAVPRDAELFSSYTYSLDPTMVRRQHLSSGKFFDCRCERCRDPTELGTHLGSLKCNKCDPGLILASDPLGGARGGGGAGLVAPGRGGGGGPREAVAQVPLRAAPAALRRHGREAGAVAAVRPRRGLPPGRAARHPAGAQGGHLPRPAGRRRRRRAGAHPPARHDAVRAARAGDGVRQAPPRLWRDQRGRVPRQAGGGRGHLAGGGAHTPSGGPPDPGGRSRARSRAVAAAAARFHRVARRLSGPAGTSATFCRPQGGSQWLGITPGCLPRRTHHRGSSVFPHQAFSQHSISGHRCRCAPATCKGLRGVMVAWDHTRVSTS
ncbi:SET domain-containing protein SmydA-8 isoform X2 [Bacillus rossius redtenbacheri]|uniref:SET domain-containing protein SmydA-8 isoform X2 n=1 Tax=Bacillus rossius redtenbacheri TaxID=93214 RepID=UPI002FDEFE81